MDRIALQTNVLQANQEKAVENRKLFDSEGSLVVNLMSAPGAGKTTLLESTIRRLQGRYRLGVIEGDLQTELDSERIRALGVPAQQITTGTVCHLDARMVARALADFPLRGVELLFIENVGNLICPASYFLGEDARVVICSVTEGEEKPKKYPVMFHKADAVVLNKIDLTGPCEVDLTVLRANVRDVNPKAPIFELSSTTGQGFEAWIEWLGSAVAKRKQLKRAAVSA
jgi:hydrogenase nickel incorporation protein HypB